MLNPYQRGSEVKAVYVPFVPKTELDFTFLCDN